MTCAEAEMIHRLHDEGLGGNSDGTATLRRHSLDPDA